MERFQTLLKEFLCDDEFTYEHNGSTISCADGSVEVSPFTHQDFQLHEDYESSCDDYLFRITINNGHVTMKHRISQELAHTLKRFFINNDDDLPLSKLNHPPSKPPIDKLLHSDFITQSKMHADCVAVDFNGSTLTYAQLDSLSSALAVQIPCTRAVVPLLLPPSLELYIGYLAALKSANAFSPFDLQAPVERQLGLLDDLDASVVLGLGERDAWIKRDTQYIDVSAFMVEYLSRECLAVDAPQQATPDDVAYVLFTSGSTGKPKGVQIQHSAAAASIQSHLAVRPLDNKVRWFQFAPSTFDPSIMETFMSLSSGSTICASPRAEFLTNPELVVSKLRCTHMMATPSIAGLFNPDKLPDGFELWTMGEKLSDRVISNFTRPGNSLYNAYGPTEAAINVTLRKHPSEQSGAKLGPPIDTASLLILHPTLNKVMPMGFSGELAIGGPQLAKGYLKMAEQTEKAFINVQGLGRLYRTGDKARVVLDEKNQWNNVEYLGRMGLEQVKLNGRRVELGEIDSILSNTPGLRSVHTVVIQPEGQLCAYVTPHSTSLVGRCAESAEKHLPAHMRPQAYLFADDIPRSTAGKADRKAIAKYVKDHISEGYVVGATSTAEEQPVEAVHILDTPTLDKVLSCISKTVGLEEKEIDANLTLLALGIDSLRGVRFLSLAREEGLLAITIEDVIKGLSPAALANIAFQRTEEGFGENDNRQAVYEDIEEEFRSQALPIVEEALGAQPEAIRPATTMQTGLLALYSKTGTGYINHSVYTLKEGVDSERLRNAWCELVRRHEILRTRFVLIDNSHISAFAQVVVPVDPITTFDEVEGGDVDQLVQQHIDTASVKFSLLERTQSGAIYSDSKSKKLVVSLHHALFDGASLALMLDELATLYRDPYAEVPREGFVHALVDVFTADAQANAEYWGGKLSNFTSDPFPDLTGLRQDAKKTGHHVSNVTSKLSHSSFLQKARELKLSPLSIVQAAWSSILLAYSESDADDIVFGSIVGGRTTDQLEHTVGPVFTASPIRVTNPNDDSVGGVLKSLVRSNAEGLVHRHLPPKILSGDNGIIYDTTIALQQFAQGASQTELWTHSEYPPMVTEFAVVLEIWPDPNDTIRLRATCSNNVLVEESSAMMLRQFDDILSSILEGDLDRKFKDIAVDVSHSLASAVNPYPIRIEGVEAELIHHQFERNAKDYPQSLALWFKPDPLDASKDIRWTYAELDARANRVANYLTSTYGDLTDTPIPIHIEKTPEMFMAILGIVKAGGAWCPIDTAAPALRKKDLFERAGGPVVLVRDEENKALVSKIVQDKITVSSFADVIYSKQPSSKPAICTKPNHLAYLIWTSGTTGAPKGVPIEHFAAVQSLTVLQEEIPWKKDTHIRCLNFSAYTFDVSVLDVFYALGKTCGTLCSSTRDNLVGSFEELVRGFAATHAFLTPAFMAQSSLQNCSSLESLISIGEKLPQPVANAWCREDTVSLNTYGPAESTIIATYRRFTPNEVTKAHNVGLPLSTVSCFVIQDDRILLRGAVGELALGGFQNARGYHRNTDQTNKKFVNHPQAGRVYLTGDVVRLLHDGSCEFVGRNDDLVKLGGIRVELSEISAALGNCHELARETTTFQLSRHDRPQKVVCTFVAAPALKGEKEDGLRTDSDALTVAAACKERAESSLPAYMIPNVILVLTHLPHTPSNKIDRKMLARYYEQVEIADWESRLSGLDDGDDGFWSEMEQIIRQVTARLTNVAVDSISKSSHLPALGVDSIRSLQLASKLRNAGVNAAVSQIAAFPTIKQLSKAITKAESNQMVTETPKWMQTFNESLIGSVRKDIADVDFVLPCTPTQEGMLGETIKNPAAYWSHQVFKLSSKVDVDALYGAWKTVAESTQALRTSFIPAATYGVKDTVFAQCIHSTSKLALDRVRFDSEKILEERVRNIVSSLSGSHQPPVALTLATKADGSRYLMTSLHHAIYDGDALKFIYQDVENAYMRKYKATRTSLKDAMSVINTDVNTTKQFWNKVLEPFAETSNTEWPVLHNDNSQRSQRFWTKGFSDVKRANINQLLQAAWAVLQSRYTSTEDVIFGETLSLRGLAPGLESVVAPMIATLPVALKVDKNASARQLMDNLSTLASASSPHKFVGLQHVRQALKCASGAPLFPALFVLIVESGEETKGDLFKDNFEIGELDVEHPVAINAFIRGDSVQIDILGSNLLMSEEQVELLSKQMQALVNAMSEHADEPVSSLVGKIDEALIAKAHSKVADATINPLVTLSRNVQQRPEEVAVTSDTGTLSFKELDSQSNRVSNSLTSAVEVVALCIPPSHESIVHRLGIFKASKTYIAVGENLPANRKRLIARSFKADIVYTIRKYAEDFALLDNEKVVFVDEKSYVENLAKISSDTTETRLTERAAITIANGQLDMHDYSVWSTEQLFNHASLASDRLKTDSNASTFLNWLPGTFDLHILETLVPLIMGSKIVCKRVEDLRNNARASLQAAQITHAFLTAAWFEKDCIVRSELPQLKHIILTGHISSKALHESWMDAYVWKTLAIPHASSVAFLSHYNSEQPNVYDQPLIKTCIARFCSREVAILAEAGELCAFSDEGEYIRSGLVARMISSDSVLLERKVGDIVNYRDIQINLEKVSRNVESVSRQNIVSQAMVLQHPESMQPDIVAFVARAYNYDPLDGSTTDIDAQDESFARSLTQSCAEKLGYGARPDIILPMTFLPICDASNGHTNEKILRRLFTQVPLRNMVKKSAEMATDNRRALTAEEKIIAIALSEQTGVGMDTISSSTTTLELGVDSLSAISLSFLLKSKGLAVPPHVVLSGPSVEKLAKLADSTSSDGNKDSSAVRKLDEGFEKSIRAAFGDTLEAVRPCLPLQEGLVARTLNSAEPVYVNHFTFKLDSGVVIDQFTEAIDKTIAANEILRTCFFFGEAAVAQVVLEKTDAIQTHQSESEASAIAYLDSKKKDLEKDVVDNIQSRVPLRVLITKPATGRAFAQFTMHHAVYDGESFLMLMDEIKERYQESFSLVRAPVDRLLDFISSQSLEVARTFFVEYLSDLPQANEMEMGSTTAKEVVKTASLPLSKLEMLGRSLNVSLRVLVQTAYGVSLGESSGVTDITTGVVLSGRTVPVSGVETMLAPCITTMPVRVKVADASKFVDMAQQAQSESAQVLEYQYTPLRLIQKWINRPAGLFDSLFAFGRLAGEGNESLWEQLEESSRVDYPLALEATANVESNKLTLRAVFNSSFGQSRDAEILISRINNLLEDAQQVVEPLKPQQLANPQETSYNVEWTAEESVMRQSIANLCNMDETSISKESTFISLGIDSISSVRFAQSLRKQGINIPTHAIMRAGCIGELAKYAPNTSNKDIAGEFAKIAQSLGERYGGCGIEKVVPATPLQTGMLTQTISSGGKFYNVQHTLKLSDAMDVAALKKAVIDTVANVDILRASFRTTDEDKYPWVILIHGRVDVVWNEHTVGSVEEASKILGSASVPSQEDDFEKPPYAFTIIKTNKEKFLVLTMHHALYDGVSLPLVLDEILARYSANRVPLRPQFTQAIPYILDGARDDEGFWKSKMSNYVPKPLPKIQQGEVKAHFTGKTIPITAKANRLVKSAGVSLQSMVLVAWGKTLCGLFGSLDVAFGQVVAGRSIGLEDALLASGPLFNTVPYRFKIGNKKATNIDVCHEAFEQYNEIEAHQHVPLRDVQRVVKQKSLFETLFVFQKSFRDDQEPKVKLWETVDLTEQSEQSVEYPLNAEFVDAGDTLAINASCLSSVMTGKELDELIGKFGELFADIVDHPHQPATAKPSSLAALPLNNTIDATVEYVQHTEAYDGHVTSTMATIRDVFAIISKLNVEEISYSAPLYALGLDSVGAIQLAARCRKLGVKDLAVSDIFVGETIAGVDRVLRERTAYGREDEKGDKDRPLVSASEAVSALARLRLSRREAEAVLPLLPGQAYHLQAWILSGHTFYEPVFTHAAPHKLDLRKLQGAWRRLVSHHPILRTCFTAVDGRPLQVVLTEYDAELQVVNSDGEALETAKRIVREEFRAPSSLHRPPVKLIVVQMRSTSYVLLKIHHALYDAWTIPLLMSDLWRSYSGGELASIGDFGKVVEAASRNTFDEEFWRAELGGSQPTLLPVKNSSSKQVFYKEDVVQGAQSLTQRLQQRHQVSLQSVLTTMVAKVVGRITQTAKPIVGVYHTGRAASIDGIDTVAGPCLNLLPLGVGPFSGDVQAAQAVQKSISKRVLVEQDDNGEIARRVLGTSEPVFNVYINLLWHAERIFSSDASALSQVDIGPPSDYAASEKLDVDSSVREMDTRGVSRHALFLDVVLDAHADTVFVAARTTESVLDSEGVQRFIANVKEEVAGLGFE
ncbi:Nonribosomal peptide synthetase 2 [Wallemia ichthyophaga EXF-994]|uniref:Nonribosomal peptide synthetase 2 n=1 Tax=Wallemia ichthyophaga (strain EXF-994 / CBS 113033) TaxID=1299270 RepID=R9ABI9_WALI9|nr:Nonribosomal peptide synthetase 2 [Wallemia ichthyophaga EXF-994]EOQ99429.1 Nonribosomal peptide synthetase 2 [Wallemia ichthyophaga EXF-994]